VAQADAAAARAALTPQQQMLQACGQSVSVLAFAAISGCIERDVLV
jgi:hypothetical protein